MEFSGVGWREAALLAVIIVAAYLGYALMRLSQLRPKAAPPPDSAAQDFAVKQFVAGVEAELKQVRSELAALRADVERLKTARAVSPQYSEAVTLAEKGADAQSIAARCGISVGEAELVLALTQRQES
jgi:hypothetical protein